MARPIRTALVAAVAGALILAVAACSPGGSPAAGQGLPNDVTQVMDSARYSSSRWGLLTYNLKTGRNEMQLNERQFFVPASTAKLYSLGAAWHTFGPDHRFTTPVYRQGAMTNGTLAGDLVLVASGDLTMGGRTKADGSVSFANLDHNDANGIPGATLIPEDPLGGLNQLASQVKASGVTRVSGDVIIDDRLFQLDREQNAEAPATPIVINDNLIDMVSTPTAVGQPAKLDYRPHTSAYTVTSTVRTVEAGQPAQVTSRVVAPGRIELTGQVPMGITPPLLHVQQVEDPAAFARSAFIDALRLAGVTVDVSASGANPSGALPPKSSYAAGNRVAAYVSPVFSEYVKLILKVSHNLGANLTVCLLAVRAGSTDCLDGLEVERDFLRDVARVPVEQVVLNDGQGGSLGDVVTPTATVALLRYFQTRPDFARFRASLPVLGRDGSLAMVVPDSPAAGHVQAKTGTLAAGDLLNNRLLMPSKALAGYIDTSNGQLLAFSLVVNYVPASSIDDVLQVNTDLGRVAAAIWGPRGAKGRS
ncbi:D-alanyl-D-alanine carboxypeptidase/D-alanyl-D-alanine endopeptidase [Humibacillus xanthopallidus]|uniref:D-alanyl-D-alanine carboxypeptidase/D-alanyl-D-alanine-endopeptidase (Penicillin-binding protein 4) n=1 Tax=Humibacillus xanthopallidus TaxID=412689 RepID=A0A543I373_9MICO|nr:D-alanyl-D-alanine carboxypeptidase/D-alanyl-D-alanine-endopeptidase [Humibacillus xanthopallidus]TQM65025.1 D-alanyl-D-alanine carboxypeptidase/D-alanyl-D-alanine-endopeptidase (penicillin-binding protein 4) [Humibacillus xanthopallidus]